MATVKSFKANVSSVSPLTKRIYTIIELVVFLNYIAIIITYEGIGKVKTERQNEGKQVE